jgi:hypothetical protein
MRLHQDRLTVSFTSWARFKKLTLSLLQLPVGTCDDLRDCTVSFCSTTKQWSLLLSLGSPAGAPVCQLDPHEEIRSLPSVMAITSNGFCNCLCLAGPRSKGCKIF